MDDLAEQGITLEIRPYNDYVMPNTAVEEGEDDANFFQHITYMENFNAERGTHLVNAGAIHYEPMGIYAGQSDSLENIPDGLSSLCPTTPPTRAAPCCCSRTWACSPSTRTPAWRLPPTTSLTNPPQPPVPGDGCCHAAPDH